MTYELYSWQQDDGRWNFRLLASPSGPNVSSEQVFDKRFLLRGIKELKRKISELPVGATVFWFDRILGDSSQESQPTKKLGYPPAEMIQDIKHYSGTRKINVEMHSGA
jgi:hypothetical protein